MSVLNAAASLQSFGSLAIFFWMFIEGFYLFLVVHCTYRAEHVSFRYYALFGWGIPGILTIIRIIVDAVNSPLKLWVLEGCDRYLVTIPALLMLGLNVLFLAAILYALNGKLRNRLVSGHGISRPEAAAAAGGALLPSEPRFHDRRITSTSSARASYPLVFSLTNSDVRIDQSDHSAISSIRNGGQRLGSLGTTRLCSMPRRAGSHDSGDLIGRRRAGSVRQVTRVRCLSDADRTEFGHSQTERNGSAAPVSGSLFLPQEQQQQQQRDHLGSSLRLDMSTGTRVRLWKLVGRINGREFAKTVKAGLMLMPLLGLPEVIFITPYHPSLKPAFDLITAFLTSTQGFWVTLLYCFLTQEVRKQLEKRKHLLSIRSSIRPSQRWPPFLRQPKSDTSAGVSINRRQS